MATYWCRHCRLYNPVGCHRSASQWQIRIRDGHLEMELLGCRDRSVCFILGPPFPLLPSSASVSAASLPHKHTAYVYRYGIPIKQMIKEVDYVGETPFTP